MIVLHAGNGPGRRRRGQGTYAEWSSSNVVGAATGGVTIAEAGRAAGASTTPPSPRTPGSASSPTSTATTSACPTCTTRSVRHRHRRRLVGPDEHRLAQRPAVPDAADPHGRMEQVRARLDRARGAGVRQPARRADRSARAPGRRRAPRPRSRSTCRPSGSQVGEPHSGELAWWSSNDQSWADVRLTRTHRRARPAADVRFWSWNDYIIEELWDYGFIEVSTDGGATWTQLEVATRPATWSPPTRIRTASWRPFGGLENGLTGSHRRLPARLGRPDPVRRDRPSSSGCATPPTRRSRSAAGSPTTSRSPPTGTEVWTDDVESGANGWTAEQGTFTDTTGNGWVQTSGTFDYEQYYLAEWRNFDGYDNGLRTPYATNWLVSERGVERQPDPVQRARAADLAPRPVALDQRPGQQPVRPAEHRVEGHRAAGRLRTTTRPGSAGRRPRPTRA